MYKYIHTTNILTYMGMMNHQHTVLVYKWLETQKHKLTIYKCIYCVYKLLCFQPLVCCALFNNRSLRGTERK